MKFIVYIFPLLAILFIVYFFREYARGTGTVRSEEARGGEKLEKTGFSLPFHPCTRRDLVFAFGITALYALFAFTNLGRMENPETFYRFQGGGDEIIFEFDAPRDIAQVTYYTGLFHRSEFAYLLEADFGAGSFSEAFKLEQTHARTFRWMILKPEGGPLPGVLSLRLTLNGDGPMELGEIAFYDEQGYIPPTGYRVTGDSAGTLTDEQALIPERYSYLNSTYFDEIYHARTAYEHIRNIYPYEITHPPLGKLIIGLGIQMFGMNPFGWRFMGVLFGVLMIPFMYAFIHNLFGKTRVSVIATLLFAFDFMHFVQTRIATIDTYGVFFTILMYYFLYRFIAEGYKPRSIKWMLWLFLSGLSFGLGIASKWTAFYAAAGLVVLYAAHMVSTGRRLLSQGKRDEYWSFLMQVIGASILFFVCVPVVIYYYSYSPYAAASGKELTMKLVLDNQKYMLNYHGGVRQAHSYQSSWWMWIVDAFPILYYLEYPGNGMREAFSAFLNPMVTWAGLSAVVILAVRCYRKFSPVKFFILVGYAANFLPWLLISRTTFAYHYFPSLIFLVLALAYVFSEFIEKHPEKTRLVTVFGAVIILLFIPFYPSLTGISVPSWYSEMVTKWLPFWVV